MINLQKIDFVQHFFESHRHKISSYLAPIIFFTENFELKTSHQNELGKEKYLIELLSRENHYLNKKFPIFSAQKLDIMIFLSLSGRKDYQEICESVKTCLPSKLQVGIIDYNEGLKLDAHFSKKLRVYFESLFKKLSKEDIWGRSPAETYESYFYDLARLIYLSLNAETKLFLAFASMQSHDNILTDCFKFRNSKTATLQHGLYVEYKQQETLNKINYKINPSDFFLAWGKETVNIVKSYNPDCKYIICGHPTDKYQKLSKSEHGKKNKFITVFLDQKLFEKENHEMLSIVILVATKLRYSIKVRLHPQLDENLYSKKYPEIYQDGSLDNTNICIAHTTTMLIESAYINIPTFQYKTTCDTLCFPEEYQFSSEVELENLIKTIGSQEYNNSFAEQYIDSDGCLSQKKYYQTLQQILALPRPQFLIHQKNIIYENMIYTYFITKEITGLQSFANEDTVKLTCDFQLISQSHLREFYIKALANLLKSKNVFIRFFVPSNDQAYGNFCNFRAKLDEIIVFPQHRFTYVTIYLRDFKDLIEKFSTGFIDIRKFNLLKYFQEEIDKKISDNYDTRQGMISVVTICYNDKESLSRTLLDIKNRKIHGQTFEYIIIDGASKDGSQQLISENKAFVDILISEQDSGIYNAMNKGISAASGQYLIYMNAGDTLDPNLDLNDLDFSEHSDIFYGHRTYIDNKQGLHKFQRAGNLADIKRGMVFGHQSVFYKLSILKQFMFNETYCYAGDYEQLIRIYLAECSFSLIDKSISCFMQGGASESGLGPHLEAVSIQHKYFQDGVFSSKYISGLKTILSS